MVHYLYHLSWSPGSLRPLGDSLKRDSVSLPLQTQIFHFPTLDYLREHATISAHIPCLIDDLHGVLTKGGRGSLQNNQTKLGFMEGPIRTTTWLVPKPSRPEYLIYNVKSLGSRTDPLMKRKYVHSSRDVVEYRRVPSPFDQCQQTKTDSLVSNTIWWQSNKV